MMANGRSAHRVPGAFHGPDDHPVERDLLDEGAAGEALQCGVRHDGHAPVAAEPTKSCDPEASFD
jgi:hypothetical protein